MHKIDDMTFSTLQERMGQKFPILLDGYIRDSNKYMVTIESNLDDGDVYEIINAAHSLKSASGLLGIIQVSAEAYKVEYGAKDMVNEGQVNFGRLAGLYASLQDAFSAVQDDLSDRKKRLQQVDVA